MNSKQVKHLLQHKSRALFSIAPDMIVYDAIKLMVEKNLGALLVMKNEKFVGILTERDYTRKVIVKGKSSKEITVEEIMETHPSTTFSDEDISECMKKMTGGVRYLPVMDNNQLTGLVSVGDLVKFIIEEQKYLIEHLQEYITRQ